MSVSASSVASLTAEHIDLAVTKDISATANDLKIGLNGSLVGDVASNVELAMQGLTVAASGAADLQVAGQADVAVGGDALVIVSESADILVGSELRITSEELGLYALPPAPKY